MEKINRVEYYHNEGEIYHLNGDYFDSSSVKEMTEHYQKRYAPFAEEINRQGGALVIHLSHSGDRAIKYRVSIQGVDAALQSLIARHINTP